MRKNFPKRIPKTNLLQKRRRGGILVEFALSIPVLVSVLYFVMDIPRYKRIYSRMEFAANCFVNMIQNSNTGMVTKKDLQKVRCASALCLYPGNLMYGLEVNYDQGISPCGYHTLVYFYYIKGTGNNKCKIVWGWDSNSIADSPNGTGGQISSDKVFSCINYFSGEVDSNKIYSELKIAHGETKIILDLCYRSMNSWKFPDGRSVGSVGVGKRFGLHLIQPKKTKSGDSYFHVVNIFTPKPGRFSDTPPQ